MAKERMDMEFAVFNLHVNDAGERADKEFIAQFGQKKYDRHIRKLREDGIMAIFHKEPNIYRMAWVVLCTAYVNARRR